MRTVAHSAVTKDGVTAFTKVLGTEKRGKGGHSNLRQRSCSCDFRSTFPARFLFPRGPTRPGQSPITLKPPRGGTLALRGLAAAFGEPPPLAPVT